jgi:hypothetical protein
MADYQYAVDTKLHTRFSHFARATPNQVDRLIAELRGETGRIETEDMSFGSIRHNQFEEESRRTGKVAACFGLDAEATYIEQEFTSEPWKDIVVHSRPDVVSVPGKLLVDYKTCVDGAQGYKKIVDSYRHISKQRQLTFYAYQLGLHGIKINAGLFALEIWNKDRDTILGYETVGFAIGLREIAEVLAWVKPRVALLSAVARES